MWNHVFKKSTSGRLIDSKVTVVLKIMVIILCHDDAVVVD